LLLISPAEMSGFFYPCFLFILDKNSSMDLKQQFGNLLYRLSLRLHKKPLSIGFATGNAGRSSDPTWKGFVPSQKLQEVPIDFAREWFTTMEHLAIYNQDVGYALDNIVQMANTNHEITFSDTVSEKVAAEMREFLKVEEKRWYSHSGGMRSMKADLLTQLVINGALSAEIIPDRTLSFVKQVVRVAPKYIHFVHNAATDQFEPYQQIQTINTGSSADFMGMKKLNTTTYKYIALRRIFEGPYPVPPFMGALEGLIIQKDMMLNLKFIMQKLGMLGFLSAEVQPPEQETAEQDADYHNRLIEYLENKIYPQLEKNLGKGMVAGFKGTHEFKLQGNNMNVQGAEGLVKIVQLMIFSGLKQDPNMLGRNYSTTETFGRVILQKMLSQVRDYQQAVDTFFSEAYYLSLRLAGYSPGYVNVVSETPMVGDRLKEAQAEKIKIANVVAKRDEGFIHQDVAANELGYDEASEEGPVYGTKVQQGGDPDDDDPERDAKAPEEEPVTENEITRIERRLNKHVTEYQYHTVDCNGVTSANLTSLESAEFDDVELRLFANRYFRASYSAYRKATKVFARAAKVVIGKMDDTVPLITVQNNVYLEILKGWEAGYMERQQAVTESSVGAIYSHYRKDTSIFGKEGESFAKSKVNFGDGFVLPDAVFDLDDFRAIEYAESFDSMYLGKFITDTDTKKRIYTYLEEQYIAGDLPFGNNPGHITEFQRQFSATMNLEGWKIRRVVDTSVNNLRNDANIMYINQAKVEEYEIVEIGDNLTCDWCLHMNGKRFAASTTKTKIQNKVNAGPEDIGDLSPFATSIKIDAFQGMDSKTLASNNIQQPCYHPLCRGRVVAVI